MKPIAKAQEERQAVIDGSHLFASKLAEYAPDPPLVDGSQMVNQCEGFLGEAAITRHEGRIEQSLAGRACYRHNAHERKALVADDLSLTTMHGLTPCCS
jgi:hypothetical protein